MLCQPFLDFFFLRSQNHPLPAHLTGPLTIFRHYIRTFVENLNQAIRFGPFEVVRGGSRMVFLHIPLMIAGIQWRRQLQQRTSKLRRSLHLAPYLLQNPAVLRLDFEKSTVKIG